MKRLLALVFVVGCGDSTVPAPAGGWPISSRCVQTGPGGCERLEAETWDRATLVSLSTGDDFVSRVTAPGGATLVTITPSNGTAWYQPTGITARPGGGWVIAGALLGPGGVDVGDQLVTVPFAYNRLVVATDAGGAPVWNLVIEGETTETTLVASRTDGSVAVGGDLLAETIIGDDTLDGPTWVYDFFLAAITPSGAWDWAIELPAPERGAATGDFQLAELQLGPASESIAIGELRGTLSAAGDTVTGPTEARAVASEHGDWLELAAAP